jgi:hypothetical protein
MYNKLIKTGFALLIGCALTAPRAAYAVGEVNGRIEGVIKSKDSGAPLGGIDIKVSSPTLIGGPRTLVSNDDGSYEVVELPPGVYDVEVGFPGTVPTRRRIEVRQGQTAPLNMTWSAQLEEVQTYHVVEERHPTNPDSTQTGAVFTKDQQSRIATTRNYQGLAAQVAGAVDPANTGNFQIKGGNLSMNHYMVDGLDITDPVTNTFSANINFDSISSEQVLTGGFEAQYNSLGGIINLTTVGGSDRLQIDSSFYVNNALFSSRNQFGAQGYDGVKDLGMFIFPSTQSYGANLNIGGPILKHRLWYNVSFEYDYTERSIPAGPPLQVQHPPRRANVYLIRTKLTWQASAKNLITLSVSADPATFDNTAQSNTRLGLAENHQNQGGAFAIAQWDYLHSQNLNTNVQLGFQFNHLDSAPQPWFGSFDNNNFGNMYSPDNNTYIAGRPQHVNNDDGTIWYQGRSISLDKRFTVQLDPSVSLRGKWLGQHDAKFGIQSRFTYHRRHIEIPGDVVYNDLGGGPADSGLCDPASASGNGCNTSMVQHPVTFHQQGFGIGAYAQDRWKPIKRLTILPGVRIDFGHTENTAGQTVSNLFGVGPRLGATYDLTGDQKTIFSVFYGRSNETLSLLAASNTDQAPSTTYKWNPNTHAWDYYYRSGGRDGVVIAANPATPHTDELTTSLKRELFPGTLASATYTYKRISNIWDSVEFNQIWNQVGNQVARYANGVQQQIFLYTTPNQNFRIYQGVDFELEARPTQALDFYAAYTLSWLYGPGSDELGIVGAGSAFANKRQTMFYDGFLPEDTRHNLRVRASYTWHGLTGGIFAQYQSGQPLSKLFYSPVDSGYTYRRSPQGTDPGTGNSANNIAEFRTPDTLTFSLRAEYDFHELIHQHLMLITDFFNLFNLSAPTGLENRDLPTFATVNARQQPFRFQLGLRYVY